MRRAIVGGLFIVLTGATAWAADGQVAWPWARFNDSDPDQSLHDGRFTFLRIRFETRGGGLRGFDGSRGSRGEPPWEHDRPRAERNFARILEATTFIDAHQGEEAGTVLTFDDPDLFKYPVAYIVEVGFWRPEEAEVEGLREYLLKGGFLIVDDFRGQRELENFAYQMRRVLPGHRLYQLSGEQEIFDSFFHIPDPMAMTPYYDHNPMYLGMFEDDDPARRLLAIVNFNNDLAEYWEYSDQGEVPIELSNQAYKFGVNYIIYAMTH